MIDNVRLLCDLFDAFGLGDPASIVASVSPDVDWCHPGGPGVPYAGAYKGREGVGQFFARIGEAVEVTSWEPRHVRAAGSGAVVVTGAWSGIARPTGRSFASGWGMVFGMRDGQITSFRVVEDVVGLAAAFRH